MTIAEAVLPEYDQEMAGTRRTLERVPEDKLDWRAHPKSNTIGWVASHLAEIPGWVEGTLKHDSWDIHPAGGVPYRTAILTSRKEILDVFDQGVAEGRKTIDTTGDVSFKPYPWRMVTPNRSSKPACVCSANGSPPLTAR